MPYLGFMMLFVNSGDINANFIFVTSWIICPEALCMLTYNVQILFFLSGSCCLVLLSLKLVIIYPAHPAARFNPCPSCSLMPNVCNFLFVFVYWHKLFFPFGNITAGLMVRII